MQNEGEYPPLMRITTIRRFLWEAWFSLACGRKAAYKGDTHYAMGSVFRTVCSWLQVLYAVNNRYLMNEKGALKRIEDLPIKPGNMAARVQSIYRFMAEGEAVMAYRLLDELHGEIDRLSGESITAKIR